MKVCLKRRQAGATLLEVLAFLGIAALILIGAISMFRSAQGSAQSNDMLAQLSGLRSNIKTINASQGQYGTAMYPTSGVGTNGMNAVLIASKALPDTIRSSGTSIFSSFGNILVDGDASDYWVTYTNVPQDLCMKVVANIGTGWKGVRIDSNAEVPVDAAAFSLTTASTQCSVGTHTMVFRGR